eukprot:PhF_6_TR25586/c0_g1_i1/m.35870/K07755/AS3MT; arsenite methyltransferase
MFEAADQHKVVTAYYGETLKTSEDLKTNACKTCERPHPMFREALKYVPEEVKAKYYGCGMSIPFGISGKTVLDLGSGSGQDCYVAAQLVGATGEVIGIDMTDAQLDVARRNIASFQEKVPTAARKLSFVKGKIENLKECGIADKSVDVVISNCVLNLSPFKDQVLSEVYRILRPGGEFYFSDVYCDRRLPESVRLHEVLVGECLGGALYLADFYRLCRQVGFQDPRVVKRAPIELEGESPLKQVIGNAKFESITFRLFKIDGLEDACEDFGQSAKYLGGIPGFETEYALDDHHTFEKGRHMLVCGNTAKMVGESWLGKYFSVSGDMSIHFGAFDCSGGPAPAKKSDDCGKSACGAGGCC